MVGRVCQPHLIVEVVAAEEAEIAADREAAVRTAAARTVAEAGAKGRRSFSL